MSHWTHITACLSVDTFKENRKTIKKSIVNYINEAPKITGSEADAEIYLNLQRGYNISSWKQNKYNDFMKYQSCIVISVQGDLRDRTKEQTEKEFKEFLAFIAKEYEIRDYSFNIESE